MVEEIRAAGGEIFAITSEPSSLASEAQEAWELSFDTVGDPHHEILADCRERGWLDLFVAQLSRAEAGREWASHPNGYFQPGVVALAQDRRVLYRWRSRPNRKNVGGATGRPTPGHVWSNIQRNFDNERDAELDRNPELDIGEAPWSAFVAALMAHGWFIRPKPFPLGRPDEPQSARIRGMKKRILGFLALWVVAFVTFPGRWVLAALVSYGAAITPAIRRINRSFQNVDAHEEP